MANVRTKLGDIELVSLDAGQFPYDGGAMFGGVPKVIWGSLLPVDEFNRIILTLSPLLGHFVDLYSLPRALLLMGIVLVVTSIVFSVAYQKTRMPRSVST